MMTIGTPKRMSTSGINLIGVNDSAWDMPKLPKGWRIVRNDAVWLFAMDKSGTRHFISTKTEGRERKWLLIPARKATKADEERTLGGLKRGQRYADTLNPVYFGNTYPQ